MENVSAIVEFEVARYFDATRRREPAITSSIWVGWTRYGSRPRPEGTPSSVDRSNTLRSVAPSDKGWPTSTSGPPVALRSARIYRGRLLDQKVIPTLGYWRCAG